MVLNERFSLVPPKSITDYFREDAALLQDVTFISSFLCTELFLSSHLYSLQCNLER